MKQVYAISKVILMFFLMALISLSTNDLSAQTDDFGSLSFNKAVNISGKQRMLGQKLAKSYVYLVNNPDDKNAKRDLMVSKIIFERQNKILLDNTKSDETRQKILTVQNIWDDYGKLFDETPSTKGAKKIIAKNSALLQASNAVVLAIIEEAAAASSSQETSLGYQDSSDDDNSLKNIINIAGRQRMLAQRLALYYFSNTKDLEDNTTKGTLKQVVYALDTAIGTLLISEFNNARIDEKLAVAMTQWETVKNSTDKLYEQEIPAEEIYQLSDLLTKTFNDVTTLYEKVQI